MLSTPLPVVLGTASNIRVVIGAVLGPNALPTPAAPKFVHHQILVRIRVPARAVSDRRSMRRDGVAAQEVLLARNRL